MWKPFVAVFGSLVAGYIVGFIVVRIKPISEMKVTPDGCMAVALILTIVFLFVAGMFFGAQLSAKMMGD